MDYDQLRPVVESLHYAFHVSDTEFDAIYARVKAAGIACRPCCRAGRIHAHALACHNVPHRHIWVKTG
jgi:hypothetical protein